MRRRVRGAVLLVLGLVLTVTGTVSYARQEQRERLAERNASLLLQDMVLDMQQRHDEGVVVEAPKDQMPQVTVDGEALVGMLQIREKDILLPVLDQWDYEKLNIAPCRYSGTLEEDNLVLMGHNYEGHLGPIRQLEAGDLVEFIDVEGREHCFVVRETAVLQPTDVDIFIQKGAALSVFTCTDGGERRFAIFCDWVEQ